MAIDDRVAFGRWLKLRRKELDLTQAELASRAACSVETVRKLEAGWFRPSRQLAGLLAESLGVPAREREAFVQFARAGSSTPAQSTAPTGRYTNLYSPLTSFIGREREVAAVRALLGRPEVRLVTLSGPPGIGKTRLSIEVGRAVEGFEDGVVLVLLSPVREPALVLHTIASSLGLRERGDLPVLDMLKSYLRSRRLLLVLDNFEQVLPAGPLLSDLLAAAPGVKMLVSSRAVLRVYGEHDFPVPPMSLPSDDRAFTVEDSERFEAVRLFVTRAQSSRPGFALTSENASVVAQICARLDGLPLAIELAATRTRAHALQDILERLSHRLDVLTVGARDLPARQQTLRGAIDWSYELLSPAERGVFERMSVFAGECDLAAALAVCAAASGDSTYHLLDSLIDKSLLRYADVNQESRYWMLETIREYAGERLEASGQAGATRQAHAMFYLAVAEQAEPLLQSAGQVQWLARLEREHDNLREAIANSLEGGDVATAARLASVLRRFWYLRGHISEGRAWLNDILGREDALPADLRARTLHAAGTLAWSQGDYPAARALFSRSLDIRRQLGDKSGIAAMLNNLGTVALPLGEVESAQALHEEALALFRELSDIWGVSMALANLGLVATNKGEWRAARGLLRESLRIRRELVDKQSIAQSLNNLGTVMRYMGDYEAAWELHSESLEMFRALDDRWSIALCYSNLGAARLAQGRHDEAGALFSQALSMFDELGVRQGMATCIEGLAAVAAQAGNAVRAASLFGAAAALRERIGVPIPPADREAYGRYLETARAALSEEAFDRAWEAAQGLPLEEVVSRDR